jgi:hypothetical protein
VVRRIVEGERADEQAHGEADAAQDRHAVQAPPGAAGRHGGNAQHDQQARAQHDADLLAQEQAGHDAERQRCGEARQRQSGERQPGIGESEDRHDEPGRPRLDRVFQPDGRSRRFGLSRSLAG